ncbi:MAG: sigma-54 dependent transcriptional regulator [Schleiferiaceae bacterium]
MKKTEATLLIIDDDMDVLTTAQLFLKRHFSKVITQSHPRDINSIFNENDVDLVLLDMNFTKGDNDGREGLYWLKHIKEVSPHTQVILMTAYGEVELAVQAIKLGATDFVLKPWKNEKLLSTLNTSLALRRSHQKIEILEETQKVITKDQEPDIFIGESDAMKRVYDTLDKVARTDANILLLGENGTGKTMVARDIHKRSQRAHHSFIHVDLGALNENLFEGELFGHKKGAYTDAKEDKAGRFELANNGTLFLDEIGNLSTPLQAKLLTVLQNRKVMRLGGTKEVNVDTRLLCATNMPLYEMVKSGGFRQDLLYRINTVEIVIPPLRERPEDIKPMMDFFLERFGKKYGKPELQLTRKAFAKLLDYHWPGNIRELEHTVERLAILSEGEIIMEDLVQLKREESPEEEAQHTLNLEEMESYLIDKAIRKHRGNISKAAADLGLTRAALYRRMEKHGL